MPYLNTGTPSLCHSHKRDLHVWWLVIQSQTTVTPYKRWFIRLLYLHISLSLTVKASKGHQSQDHGDCRRAWPANQKDPNIYWCHSYLNAEHSRDCWDSCLCVMGGCHFLMRKTGFLLKRRGFKISYPQKTTESPKLKNRGLHKDFFYY